MSYVRTVAHECPRKGTFTAVRRTQVCSARDAGAVDHAALIVVEAEVAGVDQRDLEAELPVAGRGLHEVEVGLPAVQVAGERDHVVVELTAVEVVRRAP